MPETPAGSHARNHLRSAYASPASDSYTQNRSNVHGHATSSSAAASHDDRRANAVTDGRHGGAHGASPRTLRASGSVEQPKRKKSRYIPALDGLRALAVLGVIAYHMGMAWMPGGLLGVTVFFVLSGYLITSLLLIEWDSTGTIDLPQFWLRRVKRLFPAIAFVIIVTAVLCTLFDHSLLTKLREDMWAALCWVTNWWYILRDVSYFDALGAPSPVTHFWSLAIEEQFYVVWPVVLILAHKFGVKRAHMRNATFVLALASALEMALLFNPDADPSRVYYGTDTRAFSLLIGAWLAFVWPSNQLGANNEIHLDRNVRLALDAVGGIALIGLVAMMAGIEGTSAFMYRGGILLASILVKLYMYLYNRAVGKKIGSAAMEATAMDSLSDCAATAAVLAATLIGHFTSLQIDGWCGIVVAALVLWAGIQAARDTISPLLGQPPAPEFVQRIEEIVLSSPVVQGIHDLIVHDYGPGRVMISLHAEVPAHGDIMALHDEIDNIEQRLRRELGCAATIHMDPIVTDDKLTAETRERVAQLVRGIDEHITIHDFRMVTGPTHTNVIFDAVVPFKFRLSDHEVEQEIQTAVKRLDSSYFAVVQIDRDYTT